jgi:transposase-like protein
MSARRRLSDDLRRALVAEIGAGADARALATKFGVSWSLVYQLRREHRAVIAASRRPCVAEAPAAAVVQAVVAGYIQPSLNDRIILEARAGSDIETICARCGCGLERANEVLARAYKFGFITPAIAQRLNLARAR